MDEKYRHDLYLSQFYLKIMTAYKYIKGFMNKMNKHKDHLDSVRRQNMAAIKMKNRSLRRLRLKGRDLKTRLK